MQIPKDIAPKKVLESKGVAAKMAVKYGLAVQQRLAPKVATNPFNARVKRPALALRADAESVSSGAGAGGLKDVTTIRHNNFLLRLELFKQELRRQWPNEPEKGMLRKFASTAGLTNGYASHLKTGYKGMGHNTARDIESALGLEAGWMDQDHSGGDSGGVVGKSGSTGSGRGGLLEFLDAAKEAYGLNPEKAQAAIMKVLVEELRSPSGQA